MAFYLTHATPTADGGWVFNDETKVRLAGPEGPLARHILNLPAASNGEWNLSSTEITALLPVSKPSATETTLLLWDSGEPDIHPMRVLHFSGVSHEFETELLVHMEVLEPVGSHLRGTGRITNEVLRLTGGRATPKAAGSGPRPRCPSAAPSSVRHHVESCQRPSRSGVICERVKPNRA